MANKLNLDATLFPPIKPRNTGTIPLDDIHTMYWEELGNPKGVPLVFLHGGPGGGTPLSYRQHFDPAYYRIIMYDQRGAGRSVPTGELRNNTTQHLVADLETLRRHLEIERWVVAGASWGTTLALAYGIRHPDRCLGFLLRGIFLGSQTEIDWFLFGMRNFFPEAWHEFARHIPADERGDLLTAYYRRLTSSDREVQMAAARSWSIYEGSCSSLKPQATVAEFFSEPRLALGLAVIEAHFFINRVFLGADEIRPNLHLIVNKPAIIIQGRYDIICPIVSAYDLSQAWPCAEFHIVPDGGHSGMDPAIAAAQIRACDRMKTLVSRHLRNQLNPGAHLAR